MTKNPEQRRRRSFRTVAALVRYVITGRTVFRRGDIVRIGSSPVRYRVANWSPFGGVELKSESTGWSVPTTRDRLNNVCLVERPPRRQAPTLSVASEKLAS